MAGKYKLSEKIYSIREARAQFSTLVQQSNEYGQPVTIAKYGKPIAQIIPVNQDSSKVSRKKRLSQKDHFLLVNNERVPSVPISESLKKIQSLTKGKSTTSNRSDLDVLVEYLLDKFGIR